MMRVLFVSNCSLFAEGLEGILRDQEGIEIVGRAAHSDALAGCIEQYEPDVVLLDCSDPANCPAQGLVRCLWNGSLRWITCVSLSDDSIFVLRGERRILQDVRDLVAAITGRPADCRLDQPPGCCLGRAQERKEEEE